MKKIIYVLVISLVSLSAYAQQNDNELVIQTVSYYLEGGTNNDFETMKKAFHPQATMRYQRDGKFTEVNVLEFFKRVVKPGPPQNRKTSIEQIDITGTTAMARLRIDYETFSFIDYMTLLKINNRWQIVNKSFYRQNRNNPDNDSDE